MLADIIIIALIIIFGIIGMKRGIGITILNIAGVIVTAIAAYYLSGWLSEWIYDEFLSESINQNLQQIAAQNGVQYASQNCLDSLPDWVNAIVTFVFSIFGAGIAAFQSSMSKVGVQTLNMIERSVKDAVTSAFDVVLFALLAIIIFIIVKILVKRLAGIFKLPVLKEINKLLGALLGTAEGIILVFIAVNIFYAIIIQTNPALFSNTLLDSGVFKFFCLLD